MPLAIEPQAQAFYNILEAIFDHADANLEPKGLGLWTTERAMMVMKDTDQLDTLECLHIVDFTLGPSSNSWQCTRLSLLRS